MKLEVAAYKAGMMMSEWARNVLLREVANGK